MRRALPTLTDPLPGTHFDAVFEGAHLQVFVCAAAAAKKTRITVLQIGTKIWLAALGDIFFFASKFAVREFTTIKGMMN